MSKKDEALKLALEALERCDSALAEELAAWDIDPPLHHVLEASNACGPALAAIREALAEQPAQQTYDTHAAPGQSFDTHSRTPPASKPWVGLTNKDIYECEPKTDWYDSVEFALAIEAKLREKNA